MARLHALAVVFALAATVSASSEVDKSLDLSLSDLNPLNEGRALSESGSGTPPPPSPSSPPGTPGALVVDQYSTVVTMVAAGAVEDYTQDVRAGIKAALADSANTTSDNVQLTISDGSVVIQSKIILESAAAAATASSTLSTALATPTLATSFFANAATPVTVSVVSSPVVIAIEEKVVQYPPAPPSPPIPMAASEDDSMDGGAIAGAVIGSLIGAALIVAGIMFALKGAGGGGGGKDSSAGVMFTNVGANAQENV